MLAALVASTFLACSGAPAQSNALLVDRAPPNAEVADGCALAERKCSACHPIERILNLKMRNPMGWELYVTRMRRMPGAGISEADVSKILGCLVYRDFGTQGYVDWKESSK